MTAIQQVTVTSQVTQLYGIIGGGITTLQVINTSTLNYVWVGYASNITIAGSDTLPVPPLGSVTLTVSGPVYGIATAPTMVVMVPGGTQWTPSPAQIAEQIALTGINVTLNGLTIVTPSGDNTGVKDPAAVQAALTAGNQVQLGAGTYWGATPVNITIGQSVKGSGWETCQWNNLGSGPAFIIENAGAYSVTPASLTGIHMDGSSALAGAVGPQFGDIPFIELDAWITNFTGGNNGALTLNAHWYTEDAKVRLLIENCDGGLAFLVSGTGTNSWARSEFDVKFIQGTAGQEGVVFAAGTMPPTLLEGKLGIKGNFAAASSPGTNAVVKLVATGSKIEQTTLEWGVECGGGTTGPQTVYFADPTCQIVNCAGIIEFFEGGGGTFVPSNNNGNFWVDGPVLGDATLLSKVALPQNAQQVTSGFPAGWSGTVTFQAPRGDGLVHADFQLQVNSGTVMTTGETVIASGLPSWAIPVSNRLITITIGTTVYPFEITTGGIVAYEGPPMTPGATIFPFGQALYSNSY